MGEIPPVTPSTGAKTADRVLSLLLVIARSGEPLRITDLSRLTGFDRAAVHRLIQPLVVHGFVTREPRDKRYVLGPSLIGMWAMAIGKTGLRGLARPIMEAIAAESLETVSLHIRDDLHRICIDAVEGAHPVRRVVPIGERLPLTAGPTGKAMLAFLPAGIVEQALAAAVAEGEDRASIERDLDEAREKGYLVRVSDRIEGVGGLSVPVFGASGVAAVVTTSGPERRFSKEVMQELAPFVAAKCDELSAVLGHINGDGDGREVEGIAAGVG